VTTVRLEIAGRISFDEETRQYVSSVEAWDVATCGPTIDAAVKATVDLVRGHLELAQKTGTLARELAKLGVSASLQPGATQFQVAFNFGIEEHRQLVLLAS
jgi:hypothetical protein